MLTRQFANAVSTTLSASMDNVQTTMTVASATGFPSSFPFDAHIEAEGSNSDEIVSVTSLSSGTTYNVTRASESYAGSSSASAHGSGANVQLVGPTAGAILDNAGRPYQLAGLTGATAATRYVGATTSGAPVSGTFAVGDFIVDQSGSAWVCTTAGTPGTWTQIAGGGGSVPAVVSAASRIYAYVTFR